MGRSGGSPSDTSTSVRRNNIGFWTPRSTAAPRPEREPNIEQTSHQTNPKVAQSRIARRKVCKNGQIVASRPADSLVQALRGYIALMRPCYFRTMFAFPIKQGAKQRRQTEQYRHSTQSHNTHGDWCVFSCIRIELRT